MRKALVLALSALTFTGYAQVSYTPLGWHKASINGSMYYRSQGQSLPSGWGVLVSGITTQVSASAFTNANGFYGETSNVRESGKIYFDYRITTTAAPPSSGRAIVVFTHDSANEAVAEAGANGASAVAKASGFGTVSPSKASASYPDNPYAEGSARTVSRHPFSWMNHSWTKAGGYYERVFTVNSQWMDITVRAKSPGNLGNADFASASSAASQKFTPFSLAYTGTAGKAGAVTGSTQPFVSHLAYSFVNGAGQSVDSATVGAEGGQVTLLPIVPVGTYSVFVDTEGALRRKLTLTVGEADLTNANLSLKFGDLDNDGYVSLAEVQHVQSRIGTNVLDPALDLLWATTGGIGYSPSSADVDNDGYVTLQDYSLVAPNLGLRDDR